jgi:molybdate transport repressor ModE-like protein
MGAVDLAHLAHLRYFQAIARCGSMSAAARELRVTQPTLTVAMKHLEEKFGTTLVLRGRSGVTLTRTGQELLHHVEEIFSLLSRAEQRISGLEMGEVGSFSVGCHESLGAYFLPEFMLGFMRSSPGIEIRLWNGSSASVVGAVLGREVDFGLVVNPRPHPDLVLVELFKDAVDLFVSTAAPGIPPEDAGGGAGDDGFGAAAALLRAGPLVFAGRVSQCQDLIDRLAAERLLPTRLLSCGDLEMVKSMALAGLGVALLPRRVAAYGQAGKLRRLHPSLPFFPDIICLVYRADFHRTRAAVRLKEALITHGRRLDQTNGH